MTAATDTAPGVLAHGLHALADHIATHQLPTPAEFQVDGGRIELHLSGHDAEAWWMSLHGCIDDVDVETAVRGAPLEWVKIQGRLPDTGVRVQLQWIRTAKAVPA